MKWFGLGQHEYAAYAQAQQKHLQMRDDGYETRVAFLNGRYCVQIWDKA
jgi:hypothetical protein